VSVSVSPLLFVEGELDLATAPAVEKRLLRELAEVLGDLPTGTPVLLDCAQLTFICSTGLAMLIRLSEAIHGRLQLVNVRNNCARVFSATALEEYFGITQPQLVE